MIKKLFETAITHNEMLLDIRMALEALSKILEEIRKTVEKENENGKEEELPDVGAYLHGPRREVNI